MEETSCSRSATLTLEEELKLPSNFEILPDGVYVIFSTLKLPEPATDEAAKMTGLLSALISAALTAKYKISIWSNLLLDFALESVQKFSAVYQSYEMALTSVVQKSIPKVCVGCTTFNVEVVKLIKSTPTLSLRKVLLEGFKTNNRMLLLCQSYSCLLVKRYNFMYMFTGFSTNAIGYRNFAAGPACMLRFSELDALLHRIEFSCSSQGCDVKEYVVAALKMVDITNKPPSILQRMPGEENANFATRLEEDERAQKRRLMANARSEDLTLRKENESISQILEEINLQLSLLKNKNADKAPETEDKQ